MFAGLHGWQLSWLSNCSVLWGLRGLTQVIPRQPSRQALKWKWDTEDKCIEHSARASTPNLEFAETQVASIRQADSPACFWRFDDEGLCQGTSRWLMRSIATLSFESRVLAGRSCAPSLLLLDSFGFLISLCRQRRRLRRIVITQFELLLPKDVNSKCLSLSLKDKKTPQLIKHVDGLQKRWLGDKLKRLEDACKSDISDVSDVSILQWPAHIRACTVETARRQWCQCLWHNEVDNEVESAET